MWDIDNMSLLKNTYWCILFLVTVTAQAGVIDFETTASGGVPTDNGTIEFSDAFMADAVTVRFGFDSNSDGTLDTKAVFEEVGNSDTSGDTGFWGFGPDKDTAAPGFTSQLGDFFLRQNVPYQPFGIFTILYDATNPVTEASGEIWDIDGGTNTERFLVEAFNGSTLLDSIESPLGVDATLDGKPWAFGFNGLSDITKIEISFTGSKTGGIGLAFNNFSPVEDISPVIDVPEPSNISLFFICVLLAVCRKHITADRHFDSDKDGV
jgi:hypothetical protein